tara:strand:+ start:285 stop:497 length:213 start_codon:yes stop_codon:yes gene_type:complete
VFDDWRRRREGERGGERVGEEKGEGRMGLQSCRGGFALTVVLLRDLNGFDVSCAKHLDWVNLNDAHGMRR